MTIEQSFHGHGIIIATVRIALFNQSKRLKEPDVMTSASCADFILLQGRRPKASEETCKTTDAANKKVKPPVVIPQLKRSDDVIDCIINNPG